jgi:hypothetical protein
MRPSAGLSTTTPGVVPKPACPVAPRWPRLSALCWQNLGDMEDTAMRPGAAVSQDGILAPKRSGLASRFAGAILFFLVGAITATELYPQMVVDRHSDDNRTWDSERTPARSTTPDVDRTAVFPQEDASNTGGPIPPVAPPHVGSGKQIRYDINILDQWIASRPTNRVQRTGAIEAAQ